MIQAKWNNKVIAEAEKDKMLRIEGNWYFPPSAVNREYLKESTTHTTCYWKGEASYYDVVVDGNANDEGAWYYPQPIKASIEKVGDFSDFVAFWHGVEVSETA